MPSTRSSILESRAATDLLPGESGLRLKDDPYYGKVDLGPAPKDDNDEKSRGDFEKKERDRIKTLPAEERPAAEDSLRKELAKRKIASGKTGFDPDDPKSMAPSGTATELEAQLEMLEERIEDGTHVLDGEEQTHVEVLTGKRLQQRASKEAEGQVREPIDVTEPVEGEEGARAVSKRAVLEPPERDRDKTRAAKPGESAKS